MIDQRLFEKNNMRQECKAVIFLPGRSFPLALCSTEKGAKSEPSIRLILQLIPKGSMIKSNCTEPTFRKRTKHHLCTSSFVKNRKKNHSSQRNKPKV